MQTHNLFRLKCNYAPKKCRLLVNFKVVLWEGQVFGAMSGGTCNACVPHQSARNKSSVCFSCQPPAIAHTGREMVSQELNPWYSHGRHRLYPDLLDLTCPSSDCGQHWGSTSRIKDFFLSVFKYLFSKCFMLKAHSNLRRIWALCEGIQKGHNHTESNWKQASLF